MRGIIRKIIKVSAYVAAVFVILLAVAVGLFRLLLPRVPEYQEEIKGWADAAIGMHVEFSDMTARWRLSGPELSFSNAELSPRNADTVLFRAREVSVSVSLLRLLRDREFVVDRIYVRGTRFALQRSDNDGWLIQGVPLSDLAGSRAASTSQADQVLVVAQNVTVDYLLPDTSDSIAISIDEMEFDRNERRQAIDARIEMPETLGRRLDVSARQVFSAGNDWQVHVEGKELQLPGLAQLDPFDLPQFASGEIDVSGSAQLAPTGLRVATANFVLRDLQGEQSSLTSAISARGRIEYATDAGGWLVAASNLSLRTPEGEWPVTSIGFQVAEALNGERQSVSATASYVNLSDVRRLNEWLPADAAKYVNEFDPSGEVRDVQLTLSELATDTPRFDISAELADAGIAATEKFPGFRNLSGRVRTSNSGGRFEVNSSGVVVDLAAYLDEPIVFDDAMGTVIWRSNQQGTIVLSDSIRLRNTDFDSQSSLQISIPADDSAADVDFYSDWSINDVAAAKRYLPSKLIKPTLYRWLNLALVGGHATRGTTQLTGPLDKFPFDDGEGVFRVEGHFEDMTLRYSDLWPDVTNMTLDVSVDGMRLFSDTNVSTNAGNQVENAVIEIADLRQPVLTIDAFATGSLQTIMAFSQQSPIARVFGGNLDRVTVDGGASFNLNLTYPITDRLNYDFETRIQTSGGSIAFAGFEPSITELNGFVTVARDEVSSEGLFGRFLGEQIDLTLRSAGDAQPKYSVIAEGNGRLVDSGLFEELAPALQTIVTGETEYRVNVLFPRAGQDEPAPLRIEVDSNLLGMAVDLPVPLQKAPGDLMPLSFGIAFPAAGRIVTDGSLSDEFEWNATFENSPQLGWDIDRGVLRVGDGDVVEPDTRGFHIVGQTPVVVLADWLSSTDERANSGAVAERIRSIDLQIGQLRAVGQDLLNHQVQIERSAHDWVVRLSGDEVTGTITVPYEFAGGQPLALDMRRLVLPGLQSEPAGGTDDNTVDPRNLPPLTINADEFALGNRFLGQLNAAFAATAAGLESTVLETRDESFSIGGSAGWVVDNGDVSAQRVYLNADLTSSNVRQTMDRLGYQPGVQGKRLRLTMDVGWDGAPAEDFLQRVEGNVAMRMGEGQLVDVEPGAGRVFGLMSVVALPRRLSLDFSDVFDKGYSFDNIVGTFRLDGGQAYTCDLSVEGPAADVGIVGRTGLSSRDYEQTAVISANVGNTLPVVGGVIAGPQVAAALLIFSQIFKKPLQEVGQIYYGISGSWDEPAIENTDAQHFAAISSAAGCIDDAG